MKKVMQYIIPVFLIVFLASPAFGFAGMTASNSTNRSEQFDTGNATESDKDIILIQHLLEVDAVQLQSENKLLVRETLAFKNIGDKNFNGLLRTWVPDGAEGFRVGKSEMTKGATPTPIQSKQNGNIISWKDFIKVNDPAQLYVVEYLLPAENTGTFTKSKYFSKKLTYPTLVNYKYTPKQGLPPFILKLTVSKDSSIALLDENRNKITPEEISEADNSIINRWSDSPQFKEITVEISKPAVTPTSIAGYVIIGLIIILVFSYPVIRKRSEKLRTIEDKIKNALKSKETEETEEEISEETAEEPAPEALVETGEPLPGEELAEFEGKTRDELENLKNELLSKLDGLEKDYSSGNLLDEEYDELRESYQDKIDKITRMIEQPG